jgi:hypothetical protein
MDLENNQNKLEITTTHEDYFDLKGKFYKTNNIE